MKRYELNKAIKNIDFVTKMKPAKEEAGYSTKH